MSARDRIASLALILTVALAAAVTLLGLDWFFAGYAFGAIVGVIYTIAMLRP